MFLSISGDVFSIFHNQCCIGQTCSEADQTNLIATLDLSGTDRFIKGMGIEALEVLP